MKACIRLARKRTAQSLVLVAIMLVAILGMLALAIDAGTLWGQKRFMQNGADAGALGAATLLANNVASYPGGAGVYFLSSDAEVRNVVDGYFQSNQNPGLTDRTADGGYELYYFVTLDGSYNGNLGDLAGNAWVASPTSDGDVPDGTYRIRVVTHTTMNNFVAGIIGQDTTDVSASAVAGIYGEDIPTSLPGQLLPLTAWDHLPPGPPTGDVYDFGQEPDSCIELWGSKPEWDPDGDGKNNNLNDYKNVLDLTTTRYWKDGLTADYTFLDPSGSYPAEGINSNVANQGPWNRAGFSADPRHAGSVNSFPDAAWWTGNFFGGVVHVGNNIPIYTAASPAQSGDLGNNVALGVWGRPGYIPDQQVEDCLFCDKSKYLWDYKYSGAPYNWGPYRTVMIAMWNNPEWWIQDKDTGQWKWVPWDNKKATGSPQRVQITMFHAFKIFRDKGTANSEVWGQWTSALLPPGGGGDPPSSWYNSVRLVE